LGLYFNQSPTMKKLLITLFAISLLTSCSGDDNTNISDSDSNSILLKGYSFSNPGEQPLFLELSYTGSQIQSIKSKDLSKRQEYIYNGGQISNIKTYSNNKLDYEVKIYYNQSGKIESYFIFSHIGENRIGEEVYRHDISYPSENTFIEKTYHSNTLEYSTIYTLQNGNIIEEKQQSSEGYITYLRYEYDDKIAPKRNIAPREIFQIIRYDNNGDYNLNNYTKRSLIIKDEIIEEQTFTFTYNSDNYPTTKTMYLNGKVMQEYKYSY